VWQLPVTIEVTQDVQLKNLPAGQSDGSQQERGSLYIGLDSKPFLIKKGQTFEMVTLEPEGACRIRFEKREYFLSSCPWLDGYRDHQSDIFKVIPKQVGPSPVRKPPLLVPVVGGDFGNSLQGSATVGLFLPDRRRRSHHEDQGWQVLVRYGRGGAALGAGRAMYSGYGVAAEHLATVTRTASRSGKLSPHATYVGGELAFTIFVVRTSVGFSTRVSGPPTGQRNVLTWSVGAFVPIWR
jgi:hypothetical protein